MDIDQHQGNILHRGRQDKEYAGHPPIMKLHYKYKYPFTTMALGYLNKYTWEPKFTLTTICKVEQIDEDRFAYIRRHDTIAQYESSFERVTVNRKDKTMVAETLGLNSD